MDASLNYRTSCIADAVVYAIAFRLINLQKILKKIPSLEEFVWKESIYLISHFYHKVMRPICYFSKHKIKQYLLEYLKFRKYKKNQIVNLSFGGILLFGQLELESK